MTPNQQQKGRKYSISQVLGLLAIFSGLLTGALITLLLTLRLSAVMYSSQTAHINGQLQSIVDKFTWYLKDREQVLSDHAGFPILVQALMQPESQQGIVQDFIQGLSILGEKYQEVLLDFEGNVLAASLPGPIADYKDEPWLKTVLAGKQLPYRGLSRVNKHYYWRLAIPIRVNGLVEGALVLEIPLTDIMDSLQLSRHMQGLSATLINDGREIAQVGERAQGKSIVVSEPLTGLDFAFRVDETQIIQAKNKLIQEVTLLMFLVVTIVILLSMLLGKYWFVRPLKTVQDFSRALAEKSDAITQDVHHQIKELDQLHQGFVVMAERITKREQALNENHRALTKAHQELKESQAQLVQSEKMASLGIMAAGVAHEINNPLAFIKGNLVQLSDDIEDIMQLINECCEFASSAEPPEAKIFQKTITQCISLNDLRFLAKDIPTMLQESVEGTKRVADIVSGLKDFTRAETGTMENYDLNQCIETTLKVVWNQIKYHCEINKQLNSLPQLQGHPGEINQVLMNLIMNAAQAIDDSGTVTITTRVLDNQVVLEVADTGCGIDQTAMDKLFTPFFTTKEVGQGTGLGLSISKGIIEKHGGRIEVKSIPQRGSQFIVFLPYPETLNKQNQQAG